MPEEFHYQVKKLVIPYNKQDAWVYKAGSTGIKRDKKKLHQGVWYEDPKVASQAPLRKNPVELWVFFKDSLGNVDIADGLLDNNPNQGEFGYTCKDLKKAKPNEMIFFLPNTKRPKHIKSKGIWLYPEYKQEHIKKLDDGATGFLTIGDKMDKDTKYHVGGAWNVLGLNEKVVTKKKTGKGKVKKEYVIYVRTPKKEVFPLNDLSPSTKITKVKDKIKTKKDIPVEDQRLFFNDDPLDDPKTLKESGVKNGDTIDLGPMKIYVKNQKGKRFKFQVEPDEKIKDIMQLVEKKEGTPVDKQILHFLRKRLKPQKTLIDYKIKHENTIDLSVAQPTRCFVEVPESMMPGKNEQPNRIEVDLDPTKTIGDIKDVVEDKLGIPKRGQRVFHMDNPDELDDDLPLGKTRIQPGDVLKLRPPEVDVEMPNGKKRTFFMDPDETVSDFKDRNRVHFPPGTRLLFDDEELDDDEPLVNKVGHREVLVAEPPKIDIELPNREKISLLTSPKLTFDDVKDVIEEKTGIPKARQRLFYMDNELDDEVPVQKSRLSRQPPFGQPIKMVPLPPEVKVKLPNGKKRTFIFDPEETVGDFKNRNKKHFPLGGRLLFDDEVLDDDEKLGDCNIKPGVVLVAEPPMIDIELPNGEKISLIASPKQTFGDIKDVIEEKTGVPKARQRLFFMDNELDDEIPMQKSRITKKFADGPLPLKMIPIPPEVEVKMPNGKTRMFVFDPEETVSEFKERNKRYFPYDHTRLMCDDEELIDDVKLEECNIRPGVVLCAEPAEVLIELPGAKKIKLSTHPKLTLEDIKDSIEEETGIPKAKQRLFYMDNELEDDLPLNKVNLMPGTCLKLGDLAFDDDDDMDPLEQRNANRQGIFTSEPQDVEIMLPDRRKITLSILPTTTIGEVKKIIEEKIPEMKKKHQRIFFFDMTEELDDSTPFNKLKLDKGKPLEVRPFEINIKHYDGRKYKLNPAPTEYIDDIKDQIYSLTKVPVESQRLSFNEQSVDDTLTLEQQGIDHGSTLVLHRMILYIDIPNDRQLAFEVELGDTIKQIKKRVSKQNGEYPIERQCLLLGGTELGDKATLAECNIDHDDIITMELFEISVLDGSDGTTFPLRQLLPSSSGKDIRRLLLDINNTDCEHLFFGKSAVQDNVSLKHQGIRHKSLLVIRSPSSGDIGYTPGERLSVSLLKTTKFKDVEDELIMPAEPNWKTRTFIFDNDGHNIDSNITINVLHWSGETLTFNDVHWRETVKSVKERIENPEKISSYSLLLNGKILNDKKTLMAQGVKHKAYLVMQRKKPKSLKDLPQVTKVNFGSLPSQISRKVAKMNLVVKTWRGDQLSLSFDPNEYADDVKDAIAQAKGIPTEYQQLTYDGKLLDDTLTLLEMNIPDGSTLCLEKMTIKIELPTKKQLSIDVEYEHSIDKIKRLISKNASYEVYTQFLFFGSEMLEDSKTLRDYNIHYADVLRLETFEVNILSVNGNGGTFTISSLNPKSTIGALKDAIFEKMGLARSKQLLKFQGQIANDARTLVSQGIKHKAIVMLEIVKAQDDLPKREHVSLSLLPKTSISAEKKSKGSKQRSM